MRAGIAGIAALPESIADDDDLRAVAVLLGGEGAPDERGDSKDGEKFEVTAWPFNCSGVPSPVIAVTAIADGGEVGEDVVLCFPVEIVGGCRGVVGEADIAGILEHHHDAVGVLIREGPQHHGVERREDGSIRSDAQGEGEDRDGGEAGGLAEKAQSVAKVGCEGSHLIKLRRRGEKVTETIPEPAQAYARGLQALCVSAGLFEQAGEKHGEFGIGRAEGSILAFQKAFIRRICGLLCSYSPKLRSRTSPST